MNDYSLGLTSSYQKKLLSSEAEVAVSLGKVIGEYLQANDTTLRSIPAACNRNIREIGLRAIVHVFRLVLRATRSLEVAAHQSKKASLYFVEFMAQISSESNQFLRLTSLDAVLFTYKKTVFTIDQAFTFHTSVSEAAQFSRLKLIQELYKVYTRLLLPDDAQVQSRIEAFRDGLEMLLRSTKRKKHVKMLNMLLQELLKVPDLTDVDAVHETVMGAMSGLTA